METHLFSDKMSGLELWWWERSSSARWFLGSLGVAAMAGVLGGVLA